jgi:release factor glutamine methyltransferase
MQALKSKIIELLRSSPHAKSPEAEAEQILFHVLRMSNQHIRRPSELSTHNVSVGSAETLEALHIAENRAKGVPLQHLLGYQFFYSREYAVDSSTLIPRPETEILVDEVIRYFRARPDQADFRFAELGLGSGVISCELLSHFQKCSGVASELDPHAIKLANRNLRDHLGETASRLQILESPSADTGFEIFRALAPFDLILSNPPYLSTEDEIETQVKTHEPGSALFPMNGSGFLDPMYFYRNFIDHAPGLLSPRGVVFMEIPHERANEVVQLFTDTGFSQARLLPDLTGRARVLFASRIPE